MNITLPFVSLRHEKIRYVPPDVVLVRDRVSSENLL